MMKIQTLAISFLAVSTLGSVAFPALADSALIQETRQESYTTGNDNTSIQQSNQQNRSEEQDRNTHRHHQPDSTGVVQRSDQYCDQLGEWNTCIQENDQRSTNRVTRERDRRH
jgi:regulatory protein YycH of two-component signal transduction system YycFG